MFRRAWSPAENESDHLQCVTTYEGSIINVDARTYLIINCSCHTQELGFLFVDLHAHFRGVPRDITKVGLALGGVYRPFFFLGGY